MALKQQTSSRDTKSNALDCDLVIVGGGIVGATLASALKDSGLKILIVEANPLEVVASRRQAYALSLLSGRIYEGIGVWQNILPKIAKFRNIRLSDGEYPQIVKFNRTELDTEFLGYVAEHKVVLTALQELIAQCPNITWLCPAKVIEVESQNTFSEIKINLNGTTKTIKTKLIIGADGSRSRIRSLAGIKTRGWKYWQSCVAFTIKHTAPQNDIAFEKFWSTGPMGILPLPGNRCQIVWTHPHAEAKAIQQLNEQEFLEKLNYYTGGLLGEIELISDRAVFPVQLMQCDRYVQSRIALVGDAAHCCHPVGGQGLNLGIRDAAALAQILQQAHQQSEDIGELQVLKRYENWRKRENLTILGFTDFLDRTFSNSFLPIVVIRRFGLWLMNNCQPLKIFALKLMTGLKGRTPQLAQR